MTTDRGDPSKSAVIMVTQTDLKEAYSELKANIEPKIDDFNSGKSSPKWKKLQRRVEKSVNTENVGLEKAISSLGIGDLVVQLHNSQFYRMLIMYMKGIEHCTLKRTVFMKNMNNSAIIAYIESEGLDSLLSLVVYKTDDEGTLFTEYSISILKEEGNKISLLPFSDIMKRVKSVENSR